MKRLLPFGFALVCLLTPMVASAFVAQTIALDGHNDFDASNLIKDDSADTQPFCSPTQLPLDLGRVYITNDANFLYIGVELAKACFCNMNLGIAIDVNSTATGGATDPFARAIGWTSVTYKPDFVIYDVLPVSCNSFNYEALYRDSLGTWLNKSTLVNPTYGSGSNGLGIADDSAGVATGFREIKLPLSVLGATTGTPLHIEMWTVQDGSTKGPEDALMSDNVQMSHPGTTTWDTTATVQMTQMATYTVLNAIDTIPPVVSTVKAGTFAVQASGQFSLLTNKVDVTFNEPVDQVTAETKTNYAFTGPVTRTISGAARDASASNIVHLTLNSPITANVAPFGITVTNVKDLASNTIVNNATTNVGSFYLQNVTFNGDFHLGLCSGAFAVTDTFAIEGSVTPVTIDALFDNALLLDTAPVDSIYSTVVPFCIPHVAGADTLKLEWKFSHKPNTGSAYEPLSANRVYKIDAANGATASVTGAWNNDDPANFISHAVDVIFQVNAALFNPTGADIITLLGSVAPLHFTQPGTAMFDDGTHGDLVAGDKIYTNRITFPSCSPKDVNWKVDYNGTIECLGQGDRSVYLNDALFSSTTPITLPARGIDRCTVTDKPLTVVFKVNMSPVNPLPSSADTVVVKGSIAPLTWGWPPVAGAVMADDGAGYDSRLHDGVFTKAVTFPDSSALNLEFKYDFKVLGGLTDSLECAGYPNRTLTLDDVANTSGTPIVRIVNPFNYCSDPTAVLPIGTPHVGTAFGVLRPVMPNPIARHASFSFELYRTGHVTFSLYDVTGRRVARLVNATLPAGVHSVAWNGVSDGGTRLASGVYMYEVAMGADRLSRRMILVH
jgi:hypothetical protein